jgi:hypothetical protein
MHELYEIALHAKIWRRRNFYLVIIFLGKTDKQMMLSNFKIKI